MGQSTSFPEVFITENVTDKDGHNLPGKRREHSFLKIWRLAGILILAYLAFKIDWSQFRAAFSRVCISLIIGAVLLNIPILFLKAWRWKSLLDIQSYRVGMYQSVMAYLSGMFLGIVTPGQVGEFSKALYLRQLGICSVLDASVSVLFDRVLDLFILLLLALIALIVIVPFPGSVLAGLIGLTIFVTCAGVFLIWEKYLTFLIERIVPRIFPAKIASGMTTFYNRLMQFRKPKTLVPLLMTVAAQALVFYQCVIIAMAFGIESLQWHIVPIIAITNLIAVLPISISGLGTREATLVFLMGPYGVGSATAVAYSIGILVTAYIGSGMIGFLAWNIYPLKLSKQPRTSTTEKDV